MSLQGAQEFLKKLESDPDLKARFINAPDTATWHQMAKDAGFDFSLDEFKQALDERSTAPEAGELKPEELQAIVGGSGLTPQQPIPDGDSEKILYEVAFYPAPDK